MTPAVQAARLLGDFITVFGAWFHSPLTIAGGLLIIAGGWSYGLALDRRRAQQ
jgi:hypothetical protein